MIFLRRLFVLLLLTVFPLSANVLLESENHNIELLGLPFYEDKSSSLSFEEIKTKSFRSIEGSVASFGFTKSRYWFKIIVDTKADAQENLWWLSVNYPLLDKVDVYVCDMNSTLITLKKSGKLRPLKDREIKDRNFLFQLNPEKPHILYVSVNTHSSMQVPMNIHTSKDLMSSQQYILVLSGLYYGVFAIVFFYNFISFVYTRKRNYFLYLVFITTFGLYQLSLDGLGIQFLWSESYWMVHHGNGTMMGVMILTVIMFSREFVRTKEYAPFIDKGLLLLSYGVTIITILATFRPYGDVVVFLAIISVILPPILLTTGIIAYRKKFYPARFYIIGWGLFLGGSVLFAMNKFAIIEGYTFLSYAQQVGSVLEMIFLSWALADLQKQSERDYLEKLSGLNTLLQDKVDESLVHIRQNDQVLIEKSRLAAMGEMIEQIAHQWRQPLNTLSLINQNIYFKVILNTAEKDDLINAHDQTNEQLQYMSQTIDDFRNFSQPNKEKEEFIIEEVINSSLNLSEGSLKYAKVKTHLFSSREHKVFGMRHEMMQVFMNLIKNVQDIVVEKKLKGIWIKFFVETIGDDIVIRVEDNVGGIDKDKIASVFKPYFSTKEAFDGTGIGLYMSKEIVEKSMLGEISVTNGDEGAIFKIVLPKVSLDKS